MLNYSWPGNIREVANTIAQAVLLGSGPIITVNDLPRRIREKQQSILDSDPDAETIPESEMMEEDAAAATLPGNSIPPEQVFAPNNFFAAHPKGENLVKLLADFEKILINNLNFKSGVDFNDLQNDLKEWHDHIVKKTIAEALETTYGNQTKAASLLKITPRALRYYLKEK